MPASPLRRRSSDNAAALIIALAFVVLLTGLALAYFSRTTTERQLAHTSYNETSAELLARSAVDKIIGDFRQEIKDLVGSTASTVNVNGVNITIYTPTSAAYMVPQRNVNLAGVYNLIRRSGSPEPVAPAQPSRASAVN
jgi:Tfp pilus assembly protein PilX